MQVDPNENGPIVGVMRYLNGELVDRKVVEVVRSMVHKSPTDRPSAASVYRQLS